MHPMPNLTVKELREFLATVPDDAFILVDDNRNIVGASFSETKHVGEGMMTANKWVHLHQAVRYSGGRD